MPSIATYTPYESLLLFQSVARHGADDSAWEDISATLNSNEFIRENANYDSARLTATALQGIYGELIHKERNKAGARKNGHLPAIAHTNPRKRKLSPSPAPPENGIHWDDEDLVNTLIDHLYTGYREQAVRDIRKDEEEYAKLHEEIQDIKEQAESSVQATPKHSELSVARNSGQPLNTVEPFGSGGSDRAISPAAQSTSSRVVQIGDGVQNASTPKGVNPSDDNRQPVSGNPLPGRPLQEHTRQDLTGPSSVRSPSESFSTHHPPQSAPLQYQDQHRQQLSPSAFHNRTLPPPSPQRSNYGPISTPHGYGPPSHQLPVLPIVPGMSPMAPPVDYTTAHRRTGSGQGRGSPLPYQQSPPYPGYPQYPPPGPWPPPGQIPSHQQYQPHSPYANNHFYGPPQAGRPPHGLQTPGHPQYQQYSQSAPGNQYNKGQHIWHGPPGQPWNVHPASTATTPISNSTVRRSTIRLSGSSTPWKRKAEAIGGLRAPSPIRPTGREISPFSPRPSPERNVTQQDQSTRRKSERDAKSTAKRSTEDGESRQDVIPARRARAGSTASSARGPSSRSQSVASLNSEVRGGQTLTRSGRGRGSRIKPEPPSTPAPFPSDTEPSQSTHQRKNTLGSRRDLHVAGSAAPATAKRKRSATYQYSSPTPSLPSPVHPLTLRKLHTSVDVSLVAVSKSFAKTANLLINEITAHKLAGIFAKPLSDKDAPGYKNLILRPQDLKSIKAAVSRGSRAAAAAIEEMEASREGDAVDMPTPTKTNSGGQGVYLVKKMSALYPPQGIVNSAQLEMEIVRMFANAVMFNPLPTSARGLGRRLNLKRDGGGGDNRDLEEGQEDSESSDGGSVAEAEEGGIIADAREMFTDALESVAKYRALEDDRVDEGVRGPGMGLRGGSVSMSSVIGDEGASVLDETEVNVTGTSRKRRRIAEM